MKAVHAGVGEQPVVAITGASGYLGSVLVTAFGSAGYAVRRLVRSPAPGSHDRFFDLNSVGSSDALDGVDLLVHCAYDMAADQPGRHLAVERLRHRRAVRPGRIPGGSTYHRSVVDVSVSGDSSALRSGQARDRGGRPGARVVRRSPGLGLRSRLGWDGRDAAPAGGPPVLPDFGPHGASIHRLRVRFRRHAWSSWPGLSDVPALPVGIAHPDPVPFTDLLTSFAASQGQATAPVRRHSAHGRVRSVACRRGLAGQTAGPSGLPARACPAGTQRAEPRGPRPARSGAATVRSGRRRAPGSSAGRVRFVRAPLNFRCARYAP